MCKGINDDFRASNTNSQNAYTSCKETNIRNTLSSQRTAAIKTMLLC